VPRAPVKFTSKVITDRDSLVEYFLKPLSQSIKKNASKSDEYTIVPL